MSNLRCLLVVQRKLWPRQMHTYLEFNGELRLRFIFGNQHIFDLCSEGSRRDHLGRKCRWGRVCVGALRVSLGPRHHSEVQPPTWEPREANEGDQEGSL